jgi:glycosyl transferase family 25
MDRLDKVFYINLDDRIDRRNEVEQEFLSRLNFSNFYRFNAIKKERGALGCLFSHLSVLREMLINNWNSIMICEDDIEILTNRESIDLHINLFLDNDSFDILCLGNNCGDFNTIDDNFNRGFDSLTTSCYVIKKHMVLPLMKLFINDDNDLINTPFENVVNEDKIIDVEWKTIQSSYSFVLPTVRQLKQRSSFSNIENRYVDYNV